PMILCQTFTGTGGDANTTPLFWLCNLLKGQELLKEHWPFFQDIMNQHPDLLPKALFQECTGESSSKGSFPFFWLCGSAIGINIITEHWTFFEPLIEKYQKMLFKPLNHNLEGRNKNITSFFKLTYIKEGIDLLRAKWKFFEPMISLADLTLEVSSQASISTTVSGQPVGPSDFPRLCTTNSFEFLCLRSNGIELMRENWEFFETIIENIPHILSRPSQLDQEFKRTPFWYICKDSIGLKLLSEHKHFFRRLIKKNQTSYNILSNKGENVNSNTFLVLIRTEEGKKLASFFLSNNNISTDSEENKEVDQKYDAPD
ncbi:MAG: hypothetical protein ACOVOR_02615, partial [Rhabdochlamydiaceae bacterium]